MNIYKVKTNYIFQDNAGNPAEVFVYYFPIAETEEQARLKLISFLSDPSKSREIPYNEETYLIPTTAAVIIDAQIVTRPI